MEDDHNRVHEEWVSQVLLFFYSVWPLVVGFGLLEIAAAAAFRDPGEALIGGTLIFFAAVMLLARRITVRGNPKTAVALLCSGFLVCTLFVAFTDEQLTPTLALTPFLAFGIALPFFSDAGLKRIAVAVWLCSILVGVLGDPALLPRLNPLQSSAPQWYDAAFRIASLATASGVVLMLLWRFRGWVNDRSLARIREAEQRYALAERGSNDGLWDWDMARGRLHLSPRFSQMLGLPARVWEGPAREAAWCVERIHPDDRESFDSRVEAHLSGATDHLESEHRVRHADGDYRWMLVRGQAVRDEQGNPTRMAGSQTDVTRRRLAEEKARHDALHDPLTDLPNRQLFSRRLSEAVSLNEERGRAFSLLFVDLDRFKKVNDSLGHGVGDELLVCIARRLRASLSASDTVARLGGDEFVILLDGLAGKAAAERVADRLLQRLEEPFTVGSHTLFITASIGVLADRDAAHGEANAHSGMADGRVSESLLRDADAAMYRAKENGKARYATFEPSMREETLALLRLENDLRAAIEGEEISVVYQPIVWLVSGEVVGFEALARWWHPERGEVAPDTFIALAQQLGMMHRIDSMVLHQACRTVAELRRQRPDGYPISVSVNLSPSQLDRGGLIEEVAAALAEYDLPGEALKLELTETAVMSDFVAAARTLSRLKALGVGLHIDDFGTGHSSLALLHRLPADALKIDRSFIARLGAPDSPQNADHEELVQTIVSLGHQLGLEVVVEGVETDEQLELLRGLGCDYAQGFRFSHPVPVKEAATILEAEPRW